MPLAENPLLDELEVLTALEAELDAESAALSRFDLAAIERATTQKNQLCSALEAAKARRPDAPISGASVEQYRNRTTAVRARASENQRRLEVCLSAVRGLVTALTGPPQTYGPRNATPAGADPVLTSEVG